MRPEEFDPRSRVTPSMVAEARSDDDDDDDDVDAFCGGYNACCEGFAT